MSNQVSVLVFCQTAIKGEVKGCFYVVRETLPQIYEILRFLGSQTVGGCVDKIGCDKTQFFRDYFVLSLPLLDTIIC